MQIKEGKLLIDGKPLKAEYVSDIGYAGTASEPVHLGKDEYFLWEIMRLPVMTVVKKKSAILRKKRFMVKFGLL